MFSARLGQLKKKRLGRLSACSISRISPPIAPDTARAFWVLDIKKSVEVEYKLVTTEEADAAQGLISTTSPIGKALLGRHVGDEVRVQTPRGSQGIRGRASEDDPRRRLGIFCVFARSIWERLQCLYTMWVRWGPSEKIMALLGVAILWTFPRARRLNGFESSLIFGVAQISGRDPLLADPTYRRLKPRRPRGALLLISAFGFGFFSGRSSSCWTSRFRTAFAVFLSKPWIVLLIYQEIVCGLYFYAERF